MISASNIISALLLTGLGLVVTLVMVASLIIHFCKTHRGVFIVTTGLLLCLFLLFIGLGEIGSIADAFANKKFMQSMMMLALCTYTVNHIGFSNKLTKQGKAQEQSSLNAGNNHPDKEAQHS